MSELEHLSGPTPAKRLWMAEAWAVARPRVVAITSELIVAVWILAALAIFYLFSRLIVLAGVPDEDVKFFQRLDRWGMDAVFMTFVALFVIEAIIGAARQAKSKRD
jgi:hypothetical protein